jgi:hypothetical protein
VPFSKDVTGMQMLEEETAGFGRSPRGETAYIEANNMTVRSGKSMNTSLNVVSSKRANSKLLDAFEDGRKPETRLRLCAGVV